MVLRRLDLDHRQVSLAVHAYDFGVMQHAHRFIEQLHADAIGLIHNMEIGNDVAVLAQDHAGTQRALASAAGAALKRVRTLIVVAALSALPSLTAEKAVKEILK